MNISTFSLKGQDVHVTYHRGVLSYTFFHDEKKYGQSLKLTKKQPEEIINATFLLLTNALESIEALETNDK